MYANIKGSLEHEFFNKPTLMLLEALSINLKPASNKERVFQEGIGALIFVSTTLYLQQLSTHCSPNQFTYEN